MAGSTLSSAALSKPMRLKLLHALLLLTIILSFTPVASAQDDASMNDMLEQIGAQKGKGFDRSPVDAPTGVSANRNVHWKVFKKAHADGQAGEEPLKALAEGGRSVGQPNQVEFAMAVAALAPGAPEYDIGRQMFVGAQKLAPDLPYPYLLETSYVIGEQPAKLPHWVKPWIKGMRVGAVWPDTMYPWLLKILLYLVIAAAAASAVFVLGQFVRNFGIVAYDFARLLPRGFSSNQASLLLVAALVVPALIMRSPIVAVFAALAMCTLVQRPAERVVSLLVFGLIAALPQIDQSLAQIASYPRSVTQRVVHAQWIGCSDGCLEDLEALANEAPDDQILKYSVLLAEYRTGRRSSLERVIEEVGSTEWDPELKRLAFNLGGAAYVARAKPREAIDWLQEAAGGLRPSAAPHFNQMRAHQMLQDEDGAASSLQDAGRADIDRVAVYLDLDRRDVNSFLMVDAVPLRVLSQHHMRTVGEPQAHLSAVKPIWDILSTNTIAFEQTRLLGLGGIALVLFGFTLGRRTSRPCPRCGQARDPSEERKTGNHVYCVPCYSTYMMGASLDYNARVYNEKVLGRRETFQKAMRRFSGIVLPGLGHHVAGYAISGYFLTLSVVLAAAFILNPLGFVRAPQELVAVNWSGQVTAAWVVLVFCVLSIGGLALRDIDPVGLDPGSGR